MKFLGLSVENVVIMIREQMPGRGLLLDNHQQTMAPHWPPPDLSDFLSPPSITSLYGCSMGTRHKTWRLYLAGSYIYILQFLRLTMRAPSPLAATKLCPAARKSVSLCLDPAAQMSAHDAKFTPCSCVTAAITT